LKQHQKNEVGLEITEKKVKEEKIVTLKKELQFAINDDESRIKGLQKIQEEIQNLTTTLSEAISERSSLKSKILSMQDARH
jgi:hypothetical protein